MTPYDGMTLAQVNRALDAVVAGPNAVDRDLTPAEREHWAGLHQRRDQLIGVWPPRSWLARPGAAEREAELEIDYAAREETIRARPVARRPAPTSPPPAVSLELHLQAMTSPAGRGLAVCTEEAAHAVMFAAEGRPVDGCYLTYEEVCGRTWVAGGLCFGHGSAQASAAVAAAGLEGARIAGLEQALPRDGHDGDERVMAGAVGYDWNARARAQGEARSVLRTHWDVVQSVAQAIAATGRVEGEALAQLLERVTPSKFLESRSTQ